MSGDARLWSGAERVALRAPTPAAAAAHGIGPLTALARRRSGLAVWPALEAGERLSAVASALALPLLARARAALDGPVVVFKGPEVAARYPSAVLRPFHDVDLLVEDPRAARRRLLDAGFEEVGDPAVYAGLHHLRPLAAPGSPLWVELHHRPLSPRWPAVPAARELLDRAVPSATGVPGLATLDPVSHVLVLAAHAWHHGPLRRVLGLVDVLAMAAEAAAGDVERTARDWDLERLWRTTDRAARALLLGEPRPWPLRTWARGTVRARERTVAGRHAEALLAPFAALPPRPAAGAAVHHLVRTAGPVDDEGWGRKLRRSAAALRRSGTVQRDHADRLERDGLAAPGRFSAPAPPRDPR
jgi:hypothetical protein